MGRCAHCLRRWSVFGERARRGRPGRAPATTGQQDGTWLSLRRATVKILGTRMQSNQRCVAGKEKTGMTGTTLHLLWGFFLHGLFVINSRRLPMATTNRRIGMLVGLALLASAVGVWAADWPQWRGPNRDNKVEGFTAPKVWPKALMQKWT